MLNAPSFLRMLAWTFGGRGSLLQGIKPQWLVSVAGSWFSEKLAEFWEGIMRTLLCHCMTQHMASTVSGLSQQPGKFSTMLSCFLLRTGLDLFIKFLFLALLPFWLPCRSIIYSFSGGLNILPWEEQLFKIVDFVASAYTVTYFQTAVNGWERERRTFGSNISYFTPEASCALKKRQLVLNLKKWVRRGTIYLKYFAQDNSPNSSWKTQFSYLFFAQWCFHM